MNNYFGFGSKKEYEKYMEEKSNSLAKKIIKHKDVFLRLKNK